MKRSLTPYLVDSVEQVREISEALLETYHTERPPDGLGQVPPLTFLPRLAVPSQSTFAVTT